MIEIKITCLTAQFKLTDLGLDLSRGEEVWVSYEDAAASKELAHAHRIGAVLLLKKERARVSQPPPPPNFRRLVPGQHRRRESLSSQVKAEVTPEEKSTAEVEQAKVDLEKAVAQLSQVKGEMLDEVSRLKGELSSMRETLAKVLVPNPGVDLEQLKGLLQTTVTSALEGLQVAAPQARDSFRHPVEKDTTDSFADVPMFIPSGIVEADTKGAIEIKQDTTEGGQLNDAASALKALKKKRKKDG